MKNFDQLIRERRSIRKYKPDVPPDEWIKEMVECAACAPSPSNSQPVRFVRINSTQKRDRLKIEMANGYDYLLQLINQHERKKKLRNRLSYYRRFSEFMTTDRFTVQKEDSLEMVAEIMDWRKIRCIPVEDSKGKLVGLITARLLLRHS